MGEGSEERGKKIKNMSRRRGRKIRDKQRRVKWKGRWKKEMNKTREEKRNRNEDN